MSDQIQRIIAAAINVAPDSVGDGLTMRDTPAWDSLKHMEIIVGIEQAFAVELSFDEIVAMQSVADIRKVLAGRGKL
jgi:acyl carrier protein